MNVWTLQATGPIGEWASNFKQWLEEGKFRICRSWDEEANLLLPNHKSFGLTVFGI